MFWHQTFAQAAAEAPKGPSVLEQLFPFVLIFIVFYFFLLRPRQMQIKKHSDFLGKLQRGDNVLTAGGIVGRVEGLTEKFVTLEVADDVRIRVLKGSITGPVMETEKK
jgi:preprotein translocase subunit YajC